MNLQLVNPGAWNPENARQLAMMSAKAYALGEFCSMDPMPAVIQDEATDTQLFVLDFGSYIVIAFRGSSSVRDFLMDAKCWRENVQWSFTGRAVEIHAGFLEAYQSIAVKLTACLARIRANDRPIFICGHSLGGALAVLCALDLRSNKQANVHSVYTYGQPRIGNRAFASLVEAQLGTRLQRHVYENDIVARFPRLPAITDPYRHATGEIFLSEGGVIHLNPCPGLILREEICSAWRSLAVRHTGVVADALADHHVDNYVRRLA